MDPRRLRIAEWALGVAGAVLLASTFMDWYEVDSNRAVEGPHSAGVLVAKGSLSAWEAMSVIDVLIAITALLAIATAVMTAVHNTPAASLALSSLAALVGLFVTIAVIVRVLAPPEFSIGGTAVPDDDVSLAIGAWLGLGASIATVLAAFASMRSEHFPRAARIEVPVEQIAPPEGGKA